MTPILRRIQKLLALATSPNKHEADSAREEAQRLMAEHGIDPEDVAEASENEIVTTTVIEHAGDDFARDLATIVGKAYGCTIMRRNEGRVIALRGVKKAAEQASNVYIELKNLAWAQSTMPTFHLPLPHPEAPNAWRAFFFTGFISALSKAPVTTVVKVDKSPVAASNPNAPIDWGDDGDDDDKNEPEPPPKDAKERSPVKEMLAFAKLYGHKETVQWFTEQAFSAGEAFGAWVLQERPFGLERKDKKAERREDVPSRPKLAGK